MSIVYLLCNLISDVYMSQRRAYVQLDVVFYRAM